jgi:hypothetical protein
MRYLLFYVSVRHCIFEGRALLVRVLKKIFFSLFGEVPIGLRNFCSDAVHNFNSVTFNVGAISFC